jgi:hypothetical protein
MSLPPPLLTAPPTDTPRPPPPPPQSEVCAAQPALEKVLLSLLGLELKLISMPIQTVMGDVWCGLQEWGDCRLLGSDLVPKILNAAAKKGIDSSSRV